MRIVTPLLIACLAAAASGMTIRNVFYVNKTSTELTDSFPNVRESIIQVKPSDNTIEKSVHNTNRFPRFSNYHQYVKATTPTVTHSSQLVKSRRTRELRSGLKLMNRLQELILRESLNIERQRHPRTIIQAPLFQGKTCPPGLKLDRGRKRCRDPW